MLFRSIIPGEDSFRKLTAEKLAEEQSEDLDEVEGFNQQVTASSLRLYDLTSGVSQTLTDESVKAQFPSASADGSRIAFTTPEGELYILTLTK